MCFVRNSSLHNRLVTYSGGGDDDDDDEYRLEMRNIRSTGYSFTNKYQLSSRKFFNNRVP